MKLNVYAYRDKKLGAYTIPIINAIPVDRAAVTITRAIVDLDDDKKSKMIDYDLYHLGEYDDQTGVISSIKPAYLLSLDSVILCSEEKVNGKEK